MDGPLAKLGGVELDMTNLPVSKMAWGALGTLALLCAGCGEGEFHAPAQVQASSAPQVNLTAQGQSFESLVLQGQNLLAQERYSEAAVVFQSALDLDAGNIDALLGLAESERSVGDLPQSQRHFEEVLGLSAQRDELLAALSGLAVVQRAMGNTQGAADLTAEAEALRGSDPSLR
jgi:tetratricopeptide (TPR) repeat protein